MQDRRVQTRHLNGLLSFDRIGRLIDAETINSEYYSALTFFRDLRRGIWSEATQGRNVGIYRRNLQRSYLDRMEYLMTNMVEISSVPRYGFS